MGDKVSRVTRMEKVRRSNSEKRKGIGVATFRIFADLGRVIGFLRSFAD